MWREGSLDHTISSADISDSGNYTCRVINTMGNITQSTATITVYGKRDGACLRIMYRDILLLLK